MKCRMAPTTSSHDSTQENSSHRVDNQRMTDIKVLLPETWPERKLDIQYGDEEVLCLCDSQKVGRRGSIQGFQEYKELIGSQTPTALEPLLKAARTIVVSTNECEQAFSSMNDILTAKRNSLAVSRLSNLIFLKCNGPPLEQMSPQSYVRSWLAKGRRSADETACEAPSHPNTADPKTCWSLF